MIEQDEIYGMDDDLILYKNGRLGANFNNPRVAAEYFKMLFPNVPEKKKREIDILVNEYLEKHK